ncbi:hypothetical protein [Chitinophaga ginsengisegetis]|uniref:hypothetical protein n=1 Tax=Chitinophaga ginsengisegetis TaxID=393003 RepID=UPI000DBA0140|nr:hypothetical protein [Chitinophaga ginsengisegetis]MDR6569851.1 hypothetical protein [Chitinophaga ginsengisegetis]MDR6649584.1 hypothetical protein [Chitinophaga ginsengisegetis]MDR6656213.1 hypothetical protein [Chitinophaga ginsengisegetis]
MAKQTGIVLFTGKLENQVGYRRNGIYFIRAMAQSVRQTGATRQSAREFGIASTKAKLIRHAIGPLLDITPDDTCVNRLNKALIRAGKNGMQELQGFRFNRHTAVEQFFSRQPVLTPAGTWNIPAQELLPQGNATHLHITAIAVRISFMQRRIISSRAKVVTIDLSKPFQGAALDTRLSGHGTLLHVLQINTSANKAALASRRFTAADIMHVVPPITSKIKTAGTPTGSAFPDQVHVPST